MESSPGTPTENTPGSSRTRSIVWTVSLVIVGGLCVGVFLLWKLYTATQPWPILSQMPLNLSESFNNDGICLPENRANTNFDCPDHRAGIPGSGYPGEDLPKTGQAFACRSLSGVHFLFPPKEDGAKNNIACSGQKIEFPPTRCEKLYVLGAAENGRREAELRLFYDDGEEKVPLRFSDWCEDPQFNEITGFRFDHRFTWDQAKGDMVEDNVACHIWIQEISVDPDKKLKRIQLPYDQRIHIFAMTLAVRRGEISHLRYSQETARIYRELAVGNAPTFAALHENQQRLRAMLEEVRAKDDGRLRRECRWAECNLMYIESMIPGPPYRGARASVKTIHRLQNHAEGDIADLQAGRNPFPAKRGAMLKGTWSEIDGTIQPYWVAVPKEYKGDKPFPLLVRLHGHGGWGKFLGKLYGASKDCITVSPHGRGSMDYFFVAEQAVLASIREVQQDYNIDPNRVYITGGSMGGTGSWALGTRFPDMFAAIAPNSGNANHKVWIKEWGWNWGWGRGEDPYKPKNADAGVPFPIEQIGQFAEAVFSDKESDPFTSLGIYISAEIDPISYAENLINVPAFAGHGAKDEVVPVGHARSMTGKLKALGYDCTYMEDPKSGHSVPGSIRKKQREWLFKQRRKPRPETVRYRTNQLRYPGAYWLSINQFIQRAQFGEIEGKAGKTGEIDIKTSNVANFTIDLSQCPVPREIQVTINNVLAHKGNQPKSKLLTFQQRETDNWIVSYERPVNSGKRPTVEGPIEDLFMSPFMIVYGTTANMAMERKIIKEQAEFFANDWKRLYHSECRMKADTEVTPEDIRNYNLILYGRPSANLITGRIAGKLPIKFTSNKIIFDNDVFQGEDLGTKFCYPNPLNPNRCVAVFAATTWKGMIDINTRFGNWFMWGPYDNRNWFDYGIFDGRTRSPDTFLLVGFFDGDWKRCPATEWRGDPAARKQSRPRTIPKYTEPPADVTEMCLTDLLPTKIAQHKGPVSFDRSFLGHELSIGKKTYKRGLGVRPHAISQSVVEFNIAGRFDRFRVEAGACLEGRAKFPAARKKNEELQFVVLGDGRQLYKTEWIKCDAPPQVIDVEVKNVKKLTLKCVGGGQSWHCGSCTWGNPMLFKEPMM
ncbi:MAG: prolyl oligopeptidase family serine peptidase [Planctomycetes bacterium]|nr:prolyl oligopeptidase family serine peptidase [Planctomycetota bacterium]